MKKNKSLIILLLVLTVGLVGLTIAYFSNTTTIENEFQTNDYGTTYTEQFVSPDNWLPCDTTEKTIVVTNTGQVDQAVRISMQEKWVNANGVEISGLIDLDGNLTNSTDNSENAALINFSDNCNWQEENGYYYFKHILKPGESTSTLIDSVTFNCNTNASQTCTKSQDGKSVVCATNGDGYDNAIYTLTFKIDTIQYDVYEEEWTNNVHISDTSYDSLNDNDCNSIVNDSNQRCSSESDEPITYRGEQYYVLDSTNEEYITLLKKDVLTSEEVNACSTSIVSENGEYPFELSDSCNTDARYGCHFNYYQSSVKKIVDCWSTKFGGDLMKVDVQREIYVEGSRLLNRDDVISRLCYEPDQVATYAVLSKTESVPSWALIDGKTYWTQFNHPADPKIFYVVPNTEKLLSFEVYNKSYIRPVINVKKCALNNTCPQLSGVDYLLENAKNVDGAEYNIVTKSKMFKFSQDVTNQTPPQIEYRYIGDAPNNYVYFNCTDDTDTDTCEVWRILGVFSVDDGQGHTEQRMKLVRGSSFANVMYWNDGSNNNDWTDTNASLKNFLNGDYYNRTGDAATYGLKASARGMIGDAVYYLGSVSYKLGLGTTERIYGEERGATVCGACNSDTTKLTWTGIVGLMYPSDNYMVYGNGVNSACYNTPEYCNNATIASTGWVYNSNIREGQSSPTNTWLMSTNSGTPYTAFRVSSTGDLGSTYVSDSTRAVRPVVYLKSNIKIADGTGEVGSPYVLK